MNNNIIEKLGIDLTIGHSYFMRKDENDLEDILNQKIIPLLNEYFYNDIDNIKEMFKAQGLNRISFGSALMAANTRMGG